MNERDFLNSKPIDLGEIGWTESRDDEQVITYVKSFIFNNYNRKIDDKLAVIIVEIIDDFISLSNAPGLSPCLLAGLEFAKKLAKKLGVKVIDEEEFMKMVS